MLDLDELERLLAEATPGPWRGEENGDGYLMHRSRPEVVLGRIAHGNSRVDAVFVAALRNAAPHLLALARAAERFAAAVAAYLDSDSDEKEYASQKAMWDALAAWREAAG